MRKPFRKRSRLTSSGMSMVAVLMMSVVAISSSVVLFRSVTVSMRAVSNTRLQDQSNHFRNIIFSSLSCTATLSPIINDPSFNSATDCVTELNPSGGLPAGKLVPLINRQNGLIMTSYDTNTHLGKLGDYDVKAGCILRVLPSRTTPCVVIHSAMLDPTVPGGFRADPRTYQPLEWKSLFSFPLCCDGEVPPSPGPSIPGPSIPGPTSPGPTSPGPTSPGPTSPGPTSPGPTSPGPTSPGPTSPGPTSPGPTVPGPTVPGPTVPGPTVPGPTVPGPSSPGPSSPGPSSPGPSSPGPSSPGPSSPGPSSPGPSSPGPSSPGPSTGSACNPLATWIVPPPSFTWTHSTSPPWDPNVPCSDYSALEAATAAYCQGCQSTGGTCTQIPQGEFFPCMQGGTPSCYQGSVYVWMGGTCPPEPLLPPINVPGPAPWPGPISPQPPLPPSPGPVVPSFPPPAPGPTSAGPGTYP